MMRNQSIVPSEIVCEILCFLSPRDVVRLRTVSKQFRDISYDPAIWRTLYANARLPRPPGPFLSQPVQFFERTLIKSKQLAQSWTTRPMILLSSVQIRLGEFPTSVLEIINGKWLIGCDSSRRFVVHDVDSETVPRFREVIWENDRPIHGWDARSVTSIEGPVLYIIFSDTTDDEPFSSWKLLEFRVNSDSGSLYHSLSLDVPTKQNNQLEYLDSGHGPFLHIRNQDLIFDVGTRQFYEFPPVGSALNDLDFEPLTRAVTMFTKTHIITFRCVFRGAGSFEPSTLIQAFTLPTTTCPVDNGTTVLRLSHEGIVHGLPHIVSVVRNSLVDSINGAISIRLLEESILGWNVRLSCIDLTLPKHTPTDTHTVLPITIDKHDILKVHSVPYGTIRDCVRHIEFSDDGYARGLWWFRVHLDNATANMFKGVDIFTMRFTIDASQERCTGVLGKLLPMEWQQTDGSLCFTHLWMDGSRGKLCYDNRRFAKSRDESELVVVVDFE